MILRMYTDQNGAYSFVVKESTSADYIYTVWYFGDQTYASVKNSVGLTVSA